MTGFRTYYSNRVEVLFERLKDSLFSNKPRVFSHRLVIVPSQAMKNWVLLQLAKDPQCGIAMGVHVMQPDRALYTMAPSFSPPPTSFEMALLIEARLREAVVLRESIWEPLQEYVGVVRNSPLSRRCERRIVLLAEQLTALFLRYAKYGGAMLDEWKADPRSHWQIALWNSVWDNTAGLQPLSCLLEHMQPPAGDREIHLFATSFVPRLQHNCLMRLSHALPVSYYVLSPCRAFWSDIRSDRESRMLKRYWQSRGVSTSQLDTLEGFLRDCNPLLANFGRAGREMAEQIEGEEGVTVEDYVLPASLLEHPAYVGLADDEILQAASSESASLLEMVQADLLLLRNPESASIIDVPAEDRSIRVHEFSSKMREVESLVDILLQMIETSSLNPSDIIVMAPDIMEYTSLISAVFGGADSPLDYQVMDMQMPAHNHYVQTYLQLFDLAGSRWEASAFIDLLDTPYIKRKHRFQNEDIKNLREWIKGAGIRWGGDVPHRNELLQNNHCTEGLVDESGAGTWEDGIGRMLAGLIYTSVGENTSLDELEILPLETVDFTSGPIIGKFIDLLQRLRRSLKPLADGSHKTLQEWSTYLCLMEESYFSVDLTDKEAVEGREILRNRLDAIGLASKFAREQTFPFSSIRRHFEKSLKEQTVCYRESHLNAIRFCSLLPMRALPAKAIVLLGLQEGAFPRRESVSTLDMLRGNPLSDYCPSQIDFDRYLFLEALVSARRHLVLSYIGCSQEDSKPQAPSLVVAELLNYLDKGYTVGGMLPSIACVYKHPGQAFDASYFTVDSPFCSYSQAAYRAAEAFYSPEKQLPHRFFDRFALAVPDEGQETEDRIDLKELTAFAKNPLQYYFNRILGVYLSSSDRKLMLKPEDEFIFAAWDKKRVKWEIAKGDPARVLVRTEKQGVLPPGLLKQSAVGQLKEEGVILKQALTNLEVDPHALMDLHFSAHCRTPVCHANRMELPPLRIETEEGKTLYLTGKLCDVSPQGLVVPIERDLKSVAIYWPQFLFLLTAIERDELPVAPRMICAADGKVLEDTNVDPICALRKYLSYFLKARKTPSFLLPEWIEGVLNQPEDLQKIIQKSLFDDNAVFFNDYASWCFQNPDDCPSGEEMMGHWREEAQSLFEDLFRHLHPRKSKGKGDNS